MSLFPFHHSKVLVTADPRAVFEALSDQIEPVSGWLTRYTEKPFFGKASFPEARVQMSRFAQRWVVIRVHIATDKPEVSSVEVMVELPPLAKAAFGLLAAIGVILSFVVLASASGVKDLLALGFPPIFFMAIRGAMLSDFHLSKLAAENLQLKLSAEFSALAPNQPMHSDGAATAAPPVMAGR